MIHLSTGRAKIKSLAVRELKIAYGDLICVAYVGLSGEGSLSGEEERRLGSIMQEPGYELVALTQVHGNNVRCITCVRLVHPVKK